MSAEMPIAWWGEYRLFENQVKCWTIGPLHLCLQRIAGEWRLACERGPDPLDVSLKVDEATGDTDLAGREGFSRYVVAGDSDGVRLSALLADRPVITRSENPLHLPPGEEVLVYVSSPLWVRVEAGRPYRRLEDLPVFRPSDTWFGPDTTEGELCYASRTFHRLRPDQVPVRPHRATTSVLVQNRGDTPLTLDRMLVPVTHLALYQAKDGRLWTDDVIFTRSGSDDLAALRTRPRGQEGPAGRATRVAGPRIPPEHNFMMRAFNSIFR